MSSSSIEDQMVIRELVPGVTTLSVPFSRGGIIKFGGRATIVQLPTGLAVFNPVHLTPTVQSHLTKLSKPVQYLIAPDIEHHIHLSAWATSFPSAQILAPEGLAEKRASQNSSNKAITILNFFKIFTKAEKESAPAGKIPVDPTFDAEFEVEYMESHVNKELVFLHKKSRTLIEADVLFNMPATEQYSKSGESATAGFLSGLFAKATTTQGSAIWQKRMAWYLFSAKDRTSWDKSLQRIDTWDFVNIVPAHGDSIVGDGKEVFRKVFGWHLGGK